MRRGKIGSRIGRIGVVPATNFKNIDLFLFDRILDIEPKGTRKSRPHRSATNLEETVQHLVRALHGSRRKGMVPLRSILNLLAAPCQDQHTILDTHVFGTEERRLATGPGGIVVEPFGRIERRSVEFVADCLVIAPSFGASRRHGHRSCRLRRRRTGDQCPRQPSHKTNTKPNPGFLSK